MNISSFFEEIDNVVGFQPYHVSVDSVYKAVNRDKVYGLNPMLLAYSPKSLETA